MAWARGSEKQRISVPKVPRASGQLFLVETRFWKQASTDNVAWMRVPLLVATYAWCFCSRPVAVPDYVAELERPPLPPRRLAKLI